MAGGFGPVVLLGLLAGGCGQVKQAARDAHDAIEAAVTLAEDLDENLTADAVYEIEDDLTEACAEVLEAVDQKIQGEAITIDVGLGAVWTACIRPSRRCQ